MFFKIPKQTGRYKLSYSINQPPDDSLVGARYFNVYEDVLNDIYDVAANDSTSYLEITEYNKRKDEFRGNFHLTLYRTLKGSINVPDTLLPLLRETVQPKQGNPAYLVVLPDFCSIRDYLAMPKNSPKPSL